MSATKAFNSPSASLKAQPGARLHMAAADNDISAMLDLIAHEKVDLNARDARGRTPLMTAAENGHVAFGNVLLAQGADIHAKDNEGNTALNAVFPAAKIGQKPTSEPAFVRLLLDGGADATVILGGRPENTALVVGEVIKRGMTAMLAGMIDKGLDVNLNNNGDEPFLIAATDTGNKDMVALLLARGARVNAGDRSGRTALRAAMAGGDLALVNMVLEAGADTTATPWLNVSGKQMADLEFGQMSSPEIAAAVSAAARKFEVNHAALSGEAAKLEELLKERLPTETIDMHGRTPLQHAIAESHLDAVKVLIKYGAALNEQQEGNILPLHAAIRKGEPDVVRALLDGGASAILKSQGGKDARDVALKIKKKTMLHLVEPYYAHEKGVAVKQAIGLNGSVAAPQTARFRKGPMP